MFKLDMACVWIEPVAGKPMRALVLAVSEMVPPDPLWVNAGLALENGTSVMKPIRREALIRGQREPVTLVEAGRDFKGAPTLYRPDGGKAA